MSRPEWIKCIGRGTWTLDGPDTGSLCGRKLDAMEFAFTDATHWLNNARAEGRLVGCPECVNVILQAAQNEFGERAPE